MRNAARHAVFFLAAAGCALAFSGCGASGGGKHYSPQSSRVIGFGGGSVSVSDGDLAGTAVTVPPGAFVQPTFVSITEVSPLAAGGFSSAGPAVLLAPANAALIVSASITVPAAPPANKTFADVVVLLQTGTGFVVLTPDSVGPSSVKVTTNLFGTFEAVVSVPIDPAGSTVTLGPSSLAADGVATTTITVVVLDANGVGIPGMAVTLSSDGSNNTITQPGPTDANGATTGTLASTTAETKTISATVLAADGTTRTLAATATVTFQ